jgi:hypothetical protein
MIKLNFFVKMALYLMVGAFVFGIVAFVKANKSGELKNLYKTEPHKVDIITKEIEIEDFSRGEISPEPNDAIKNDIAPIENEMDKKLVLKKTNFNKNFKATKKHTKKKTPKIVSFKSFSRSSLDILPRPIPENDVK